MKVIKNSNGIIVESEIFKTVSDFNRIYKEMRKQVANSLGIKGAFKLPYDCVILCMSYNDAPEEYCEYSADTIESKKSYIKMFKSKHTFKLKTKTLVLKSKKQSA